MRRVAATLCIAMTLSGCVAMRTPAGTISRERAMASTDWHNVATGADRMRLRGWWGAWNDALASARAAGHGAEIDRAGPLLNPSAALPNAALPVGDYACSITKLGARGAGNLAYIAYPAFRCRVSGDGAVLEFAKLSGSQRPHGLIFRDDDPNRLVFLGTLALGDEQRAPDYGADAARNQAAWVERIGPARWRMVFPRPAFESIVDVMELVPVN